MPAVPGQKQSPSAPGIPLPAMPPGVRLVSWEPKFAPVVLSRHMTVVDVPKFIQSTLRQLGAAPALKRLQTSSKDESNEMSYRSGNWSVSTLVGWMALCGVRVEIDQQNGEGHVSE